MRLYFKSTSWINEGKIEADEETRSVRREILRDAFKESLLELFQNKNYNAKNFLNDKRTKWLQKLFTPKEIKEIREHIQHIVDNANSTIERFTA